MKLYKFRPLANCDDLKRIKQIVEEKKFWCSRLWDLNDPMEGVYHNSARDINYIRIIEAIDCGVVRSLLDDTRVDDKDVSIHRVNSASSTDINNAINFCIDEIGSRYSIDRNSPPSKSAVSIFSERSTNFVFLRNS